MRKATRLKLARLQEGFSQHDVARKLGISQSTLSLWESGHRSPSEERREALAALYGRTLDELFK
jgi:transcriptional regulator with XRE-family HTH domain